MKKILLIFPLFLIFCGCHQKTTTDDLSCIQITDRNGLCETISLQDKINKFKQIDYSAPQPYKKVIQVFKKDEENKAKSIITSYHSNGQLHKYLEAFDGRAFGKFIEKHQNGQLKITANVIGGTANFDENSQNNWIFDGICNAFDENGRKISEINYENGSLEKISKYYYPSGKVLKEIFFENNEIEGSVTCYYEDGKILSKTNYEKSLEDGKSFSYWPNEKIQSQELFNKGNLHEATYFLENSEKIATIEKGFGAKALFKNSSLKKLIQYKNGKKEGFVKTFDSFGRILKCKNIRNDKKHGLYTIYYKKHEIDPDQDLLKKISKISFNYDDGLLRGKVKTWYNNGKLESEKEVSKNKKHGNACAWYKDSSLMFIEEYEDGKILSGKYFKKNQNVPISKIVKGTGIATLYDGYGTFIRKVRYDKGNIEDE